MSEQLMTAATLFLMLFGVVAAFDGIYYHLWKYKLYARPESIGEHKLHTIQAGLFIPIMYFLFYGNFGGAALWAGVFFIALEQVVEILDVLDEKDSRARIGGLSSGEYAAHAIAITVRTAAIALALAAKPLSAWSLNSPLVLGPEHAFASSTATNMIIGNIVVGALHVWLMQSKYRTETTVVSAQACCAA